jgi:hypothetical protein
MTRENGREGSEGLQKDRLTARAKSEKDSLLRVSPQEPGLDCTPLWASCKEVKAVLGMLTVALERVREAMLPFKVS